MLQLITVMDKILKAVKLDFKILTYKVIACSKDDGIMEFVPGSATV